ncbi:MAG: type II secretion system F family protein [Pseudomonadota bacterium]
MDSLLSSANIGGVLFALALLVASPGLFFVARAAGISDQIVSRLWGRRRSDQPMGEASSGARITDRLGELAKRATPSNTEESNAIRYRLLRARYTHPNAVALFYGVRLVGLLLFPVIMLFVLPFIEGFGLPGWFPIAALGFAGVFGLVLPSMMVDRRIERVERECSDGFPDMMDLLVACVEAGLSLDAAVLRVSEELEGRHLELSLNLKTLALEMRAGRARKAAWRAFADRVGLEEAGSLATMLRQSEEMGTSLGETLRVFSSDMRQRRMLMAEEKAMALPAKMTVPLILFVFPVLLGVLIVPAIIRFQSFM